MTAHGGIPVIDLGPALRGEGIATAASQFESAFEGTGFAYLVNHGIEEKVIEQCMRVHAAFHSLPLAEKQKIKLNETHRGFLEMASYQLKSEHKSRGVKVAEQSEVKYPNQSESFIINHEHLEGPHDAPVEALLNRFLQGPNQWPQEGTVPGFRDAVLQYYEAAQKVALLVTRLFFHAAGAEFDRLTPSVADPCHTYSCGLHRTFNGHPWDCECCIIHLRNHPFSMLTFMLDAARTNTRGLFRDSVGGLEVKHDDGSWAPVPPYSVDGATALVLNLGEMAHR